MFDFQLIIDSLPLLFQGACVTVQITAISVGLGLFFGLFIGIAQISRVEFLQKSMWTFCAARHSWFRSL